MSKNTDINPIATVYGEKPKIKKRKRGKLRKKQAKNLAKNSTISNEKREVKNEQN